jgi:hypothetical protein
MVDTASLGAVAWPLASYPLVAAHSLGRCPRAASPSRHTTSPERAISVSHPPPSPRW